jgi:flagellar assembly protein FliH
MSASSVIRLPRPLSRLVRPGEQRVIEDEVLSETDTVQEVEEEDSGQLLMLQSRIELLEQELQEAREQSYNVGFQDGLVAERKKHKEKMEAHAQHFKELAERLEQEFDQALERLEEPLLRMSFHISEKILTVPLPESVRNEALLGNIQSFLKEVLHEGGVVIHVSPANLAFIQSDEQSDKLKQSYPGRIRFVADDSLAPGECLVETPEHIIDGRYKNQLAILESKLQ